MTNDITGTEITSDGADGRSAVLPITTTRDPSPKESGSMVCLECGEAAHRAPPPRWAPANGPRPRWSHRDGEPLCPVLGPDGYQSAKPVTAAGGDPAQVGDLFGFPAPLHRPRPSGCQWCEPDQARVWSLRHEDPLSWVLHVLAEHVPPDLLTRVYVNLQHDQGEASVDMHDHTFEQVDTLAEALDLFPRDVHYITSGGRRIAVARFGSVGEKVTLTWYTTDDSETENVKKDLTLTGAEPAPRWD